MYQGACVIWGAVVVPRRLFLLYLSATPFDAGISAQVYTLEKVLKLKKDTVSQTVFLEEAMKVAVPTTTESYSCILTAVTRFWKTSPVQRSGRL